MKNKEKIIQTISFLETFKKNLNYNKPSSLFSNKLEKIKDKKLINPNYSLNNVKSKQSQTREWNISLYRHNNNFIRSSIYLIDWCKDLINLYFSRYILGKPVFKFYNKKIVILIYLYNSLPHNIMYDKLINLNLKTKDRIIKKSFTNYLEIILGRKIEFRIIKMHFPYLNAEILAKYLALKCKRTNFLRLQAKLYKKIRKARFNISKLRNKYKTNLDPDNYLESLQFKHLVAIQLQLKGRMNRRRTAARSMKRSSYKGSLKTIEQSLIPLRNQSKANLDYGKFSTKNRNGAFTVKVWLSGQ